MNNLAIIFIYSNKDQLTDINYNAIKLHARNIPVYAVHQHDFTQNYYPFLDCQHISEWRGLDIWYWGSDNIFLYWYLSNPDKRAKNYLILEYDTHANEDICDFLGLDEQYLQNHQGLSSPNTIFAISNNNYWWFRCQKEHPLIKHIYGVKNFCACSPLCGNLISDDAVLTIVDHLKDNPGSNKLYVETKFATILKFLNFDVLNFKSTNIDISLTNYVSYDSNIVQRTIHHLQKHNTKISGVFHPIKDIKILRRYFMDSHILKKDIHHVYFGAIYDSKPSIDKLMQAGLNKIIVDNSLCGDPAPGCRKKLYIKYEKNGQILDAVIDENQTLDIKSL